MRRTNYCGEYRDADCAVCGWSSPSAGEGPSSEASLNVATNWISIVFMSKPDAATRGELKGAGFRWKRGASAWKAKWAPSREDLCFRLAGSLFFVDIERDFDRRIDYKKDLAQRAGDRRDGRFQAAHDAVGGIPFGQPILVGHHSEGRHRAALKRHDRNMHKGIEEDDKRLHHEGGAAHARFQKARAVDPVAIRTKVEDLEAEARRQKATLRCHPDSRHTVRLLRNVETQLRRWQPVLEENLHRLPTAATAEIQAGDRVKARHGHWLLIVRVNAKSYTVSALGAVFGQACAHWTDTVRKDLVTEHQPAADDEVRSKRVADFKAMRKQHLAARTLRS